jgi:allantoinase
VARLIAEGEHEVCAHGNRWITQLKMDEATEREFIESARDSIERTTGPAPRRLAIPLLHHPEHPAAAGGGGISLSHGRFLGRCAVLGLEPRTADSGDPVSARHQRHENVESSLLHAGSMVEIRLRYFDWLLAETRELVPRIMSVGVHLRIIGRPGRIGAFERFLATSRRRPDACVLTRLEIAAACRAILPLESAA